MKTLAPQVGLEPTTLRLTAGCSTIELLRNGSKGRRPRPRSYNNDTGPGSHLCWKRAILRNCAWGGQGRPAAAPGQGDHQIVNATPSQVEAPLSSPGPGAGTPPPTGRTAPADRRTSCGRSADR